MTPERAIRVVCSNQKPRPSVLVTPERAIRVVWSHQKQLSSGQTVKPIPLTLMSDPVGILFTMRWEDRFREHAGRQYGLMAKFQIPQIECTSRHWRYARDSERWEVLSPRVLRLAGAPPSAEQRALAAVLDASPGAMLHWRSALDWVDVGGFTVPRILVARPRGITGNPATLGVLHHLRAVRAHHVIVVRGVPIERPLRAIWVEASKLAAEPLFEVGMKVIGKLLDDAHRKRLVTWAELHQMVDDIHERGRGGTVIMRTLAQERQPGSSVTESGLEDRFEEVLGRADVPLPRRQIVLGDVEHIGRIDFSYEDVPLAIEVNSETFHTTPTDVAADKVRYRRLNDANFAVAVIWEKDLWRRPSKVVATIESARRIASVGRNVTIHSPGCPWPDPEGELSLAV